MKLAIILTVIVTVVTLGQEIVYIIIGLFGQNPGVSSTPLGVGNYLYLLLILAPLFIPLQNFHKMVNLGAKRRDFFAGCAVNYVIISAIVSFIAVMFYYTLDRYFAGLHNDGVLSLLTAFGWVANGPVVAFFQQFAFLLLLASFIHTLAAAQDKWYGWVADAVIVVILSVFIPIEPLRMSLVWFFNMIIFQSAPLQILSCLVLAAAIYALNKPILARKVI
jgi:hypothetical protein